MLKQYEQRFIDSYRNISFYGERRGAQDCLYYSEMLKEDLEELGDKCGNYEAKFIDKILTWVDRQSRTASSFITGPARFPVRSNQKKMDSADKAINDFYHWRKKYFKAVYRVKTKSPEEEIDLTIKEIDKLINYQIKIKETNKLIRKYKISDNVQVGFEKNDTEKELTKQLVELWDDIPQVNAILTKDCYGGLGYQSFEVTSVTTKIRERKKKIEVMKNRIEAKEKQEDIFFKGGKIFIDNDRVIIKHDEKPDREIIDAIKKHGFRWSRNFGSWCRKHTGNARYDANYLLNNYFGGKL